MLTFFQNSFTGRLTTKFATKSLLNIQPHLDHAATLPLKYPCSKIAMLNDWEQQTVVQEDSTTRKSCREILDSLIFVDTEVKINLCSNITEAVKVSVRQRTKYEMNWNVNSFSHTTPVRCFTTNALKKQWKYHHYHSPPPKKTLHSLGGSHTSFSGSIRPIPDGISIQSAVFPKYTIVIKGPTNRPTD